MIIRMKRINNNQPLLVTQVYFRIINSVIRKQWWQTVIWMRSNNKIWVNIIFNIIKYELCFAEVFRGKDEFITPETIINENDVNERKSNMNVEGWFNFKTELKWFNIILIVSVHMIAVHSFLTFGYFENLKTTIWGECPFILFSLGFADLISFLFLNVIVSF